VRGRCLIGFTRIDGSAIASLKDHMTRFMATHLGSMLYAVSCVMAAGLLLWVLLFIGLAVVAGGVSNWVHFLDPFWPWWQKGTGPTPTQALILAPISWLFGVAARDILAGKWSRLQSQGSTGMPHKGPAIGGTNRGVGTLMLSSVALTAIAAQTSAATFPGARTGDAQPSPPRDSGRFNWACRGALLSRFHILPRGTTGSHMSI
jgi:hypothetical protein